MLDALDQAIKAVCPIDGISVSDRKVTKIDFRPEASAEQRAAAQAVVDAWDWDAPSPISLYPYELMKLLRPEQLLAIMTSMDPVIIILRTQLQTIVSPIPMNGEEMQQGMMYLASQGILTVEEVTKLTNGETLHQ